MERRSHPVLIECGCAAGATSTSSCSAGTAAATPQRPSSAAGYRDIVEQLDASGLHADAFELYRNILNRDPINARANHGLANAARELGQRDLSERYLTRAISTATEAVDRVRWQLELAQLLSEDYRHLEADVLIDAVARLAQDSAEFLAWQGEIKFALERYDDAVVALEKSCSLDPNHAARWLRLANAMAKSDAHNERASVALAGAERAGGDDVNILAAIGAFHAARLEHDAAERYLTDAVRFAEANDAGASAYHYLQLADCLRQQDKEAGARARYREAVARCDDAIDPEQPSKRETGLAFKARVLFTMGDTAQARAIAAELGRGSEFSYSTPPRQKKATFSRRPPTSTTASPKSTWAWPGG